MGSLSAGEDERRFFHGKERKLQQPLPASAWATPRPVFTCTAYVCLVTLSVLGVGLPQRPSNISCSTVHASTPTTLHHAHSSPPWPSQHSTYPPSCRPLASMSTPHCNLLSFVIPVPS
ncbi:hypothetical protein E2C01_018106 [Portunus trituberculatus]|uniref:Uncharacterized protein n=1 Tax=Portunus trituberculatus TaxID=210409 RepID=A0A5B7DVA9_PORTR|nr:hypothetical protein [Portunus trituberculatus]